MFEIIIYDIKDQTNLLSTINVRPKCLYAKQHEAFDSVVNFLVLSNPADAQKVTSLGLCGRDICPKIYAYYGLGNFNPQLAVISLIMAS